MWAETNGITDKVELHAVGQQPREGWPGPAAAGAGGELTAPLQVAALAGGSMLSGQVGVDGETAAQLAELLFTRQRTGKALRTVHELRQQRGLWSRCAMPCTLTRRTWSVKAMVMGVCHLRCTSCHASLGVKSGRLCCARCPAGALCAPAVPGASQVCSSHLPSSPPAAGPHRCRGCVCVWCWVGPGLVHARQALYPGLTPPTPALPGAGVSSSTDPRLGSRGKRRSLLLENASHCMSSETTSGGLRGRVRAAPQQLDSRPQGDVGLPVCPSGEACPQRRRPGFQRAEGGLPEDSRAPSLSLAGMPPMEVCGWPRKLHPPGPRTWCPDTQALLRPWRARRPARAPPLPWCGSQQPGSRAQPP